MTWSLERRFPRARADSGALAVNPLVTGLSLLGTAVARGTLVPAGMAGWRPGMTNIKFDKSLISLLQALHPSYAKQLTDNPGLMMAVTRVLADEDEQQKSKLLEGRAFGRMSEEGFNVFATGQRIKNLVIGHIGNFGHVPLPIVLGSLGLEQGLDLARLHSAADMDVDQECKFLPLNGVSPESDRFIGFQDLLSIKQLDKSRWMVTVANTTREKIHSLGNRDNVNMEWGNIHTSLLGKSTYLFSVVEMLMHLSTLADNANLQQFLAETHEARSVQKVDASREAKTAYRAVMIPGAFGFGWHIAQLAMYWRLLNDPLVYPYVRHLNYEVIRDDSVTRKQMEDILAQIRVPHFARMMAALFTGSARVTTAMGDSNATLIPSRLLYNGDDPSGLRDFVRASVTGSPYARSFQEKLKSGEKEPTDDPAYDRLVNDMLKMMIQTSNEDGDITPTSWFPRAVEEAHNIISTPDFIDAYRNAAELFRWELMSPSDYAEARHVDMYSHAPAYSDGAGVYGVQWLSEINHAPIVPIRQLEGRRVEVLGYAVAEGTAFDLTDVGTDDLVAAADKPAEFWPQYASQPPDARLRPDAPDEALKVDAMRVLVASPRIRWLIPPVAGSIPVMDQDADDLRRRFVARSANDPVTVGQTLYNGVIDGFTSLGVTFAELRDGRPSTLLHWLEGPLGGSWSNPSTIVDLARAMRKTVAPTGRTATFVEALAYAYWLTAKHPRYRDDNVRLLEETIRAIEGSDKLSPQEKKALADLKSHLPSIKGGGATASWLAARQLYIGESWINKAIPTSCVVDIPTSLGYRFAMFHDRTMLRTSTEVGVSTRGLVRAEAFWPTVDKQGFSAYVIADAVLSAITGVSPETLTARAFTDGQLERATIKAGDSGGARRPEVVLKVSRIRSPDERLAAHTQSGTQIAKQVEPTEEALESVPHAAPEDAPIKEASPPPVVEDATVPKAPREQAVVTAGTEPEAAAGPEVEPKA